MDAVSYAHSAKQAQRIKRFIENPDSESGVLTQPKVIEAGETVTIKSGRQAILADTVIDGDLVIEAGADVFIPAGAGFNDLDQRIDTKLDKDFSSFVDKLTPDDTDNFAIQEVGGLLKKLSFANFKNTIFNGNVSLTTNGYIKFPSKMGGLIIQWGRGSAGSSVVFPIAFPTSVLKIIPQHHYDVGSVTGAMLYVSSSSTTGFTRTTQAFECEYIAIGY